MEEEIAAINKTKERLPKPIACISKEIPFDPVVVVDNVASLHIKLTDVATRVNIVFRLQLLLRITIAFIGIVTALFVIGVNLMKKKNWDVKDNVDVMFTTWALSGAIEIWMIVWVTCKVCEEVKTMF